MDQDLNNRIKRFAKFDFTDPFGKARIRKVMYEYDTLKWRHDREISSYRDTAIAQASAVTMMVEKLAEMEKENAYLKAYIKESDAAKKNLQHNRMQTDREMDALVSENAQLKAELDTVKGNYTELANIHEAVMKVIHEERPDIDLDAIVA